MYTFSPEACEFVLLEERQNIFLFQVDLWQYYQLLLIQHILRISAWRYLIQEHVDASHGIKT